MICCVTYPFHRLEKESHKFYFLPAVLIDHRISTHKRPMESGFMHSTTHTDPSATSSAQLHTQHEAVAAATTGLMWLHNSSNRPITELLDRPLTRTSQSSSCFVKVKHIETFLCINDTWTAALMVVPTPPNPLPPHPPSRHTHTHTLRLTSTI